MDDNAKTKNEKNVGFVVLTHLCTCSMKLQDFFVVEFNTLRQISHSKLCRKLACRKLLMRCLKVITVICICERRTKFRKLRETKRVVVCWHSGHGCNNDKGVALRLVKNHNNSFHSAYFRFVEHQTDKIHHICCQMYLQSICLQFAPVNNVQPCKS